MATKPEQATKQPEQPEQSSDWKSRVTAPKKDTRYTTEVEYLKLRRMLKVLKELHGIHCS